MDRSKYARARTALRWLRPYAADLGEAEAQDIQDGVKAERADNAGLTLLDLGSHLHRPAALRCRR